EDGPAMGTDGLSTGAFRHEALLYAGEADFLDRTLPFLIEGAEAGEPTLVVVDEVKIGRLRRALDGHADAIRFADMAAVGANPARIIPTWHRFVADHAGLGRPIRGIGEPVWPGRTADELVECQRHEALLNLAFAGAPSFRLVCPYDVETLPPAVIEEARRTHPVVGARASDDFLGLDAVAAPFDAPLPDGPAGCDWMEFGARRLGAVRRFVIREAERSGLAWTRIDA